MPGPRERERDIQWRQNASPQPQGLKGRSVRCDARHSWRKNAATEARFGRGSSVQTGQVKIGPKLPLTLEWSVLDSVQRPETLRTRDFSLAL